MIQANWIIYHVALQSIQAFKRHRMASQEQGPRIVSTTYEKPIQAKDGDLDFPLAFGPQRLNLCLDDSTVLYTLFGLRFGFREHVYTSAGWESWTSLDMPNTTDLIAESLWTRMSETVIEQPPGQTTNRNLNKVIAQ